MLWGKCTELMFGVTQNWKSGKSGNCQGNWKQLGESGKSQEILQNFQENKNSWL